MYVEQTPVPGSGSHANKGLRTPDATGKGATPGILAIALRIPGGTIEWPATNDKSALRRFFLGL
jgi:hypothetical protein